MIITLLVFFLLVSPGLVSALPVEDISAEEYLHLLQGSPVIRLFDDYKDMRLKASAAYADRITGPLQEVDPNLLAEVMYLVPIPAERHDEAFAVACKILQSFEAFEHIPYYSKRNKTTTPLFRDVEVSFRRTRSPGKYGNYDEKYEQIEASLRMPPFKEYQAVFNYRLTDNSFYFSTSNDSAVYYKFLRVLKKDRMHISLLLVPQGDTIFIYGMGGASVFTLFGLFKERIHLAFSGRVESMFSWFYGEFEQELGVQHN